VENVLTFDVMEFDLIFIFRQFQDYAEHPNVHAVNRYFVEKYSEAKKNGTKIGKRDLELVLPGLRRDQKIYSVDFEEKDD
jgi:hypothetical protein